MIDLLSPVGDFECLKAAVQNGANSVYFGADLFSARAFASNFNLEDLDKAVLNVDSIMMSIKARPFIQKKLPK